MARQGTPFKKMNGKVNDVKIISRPQSALSNRSTASIMVEKQRLGQLLQSTSGNKLRQTFFMILMVIIPIVALLSLATVTLVSRLQTFNQANDAQEQLRAMLQVSIHLVYLLPLQIISQYSLNNNKMYKLKKNTMMFPGKWEHKPLSSLI